MIRWDWTETQGADVVRGPTLAAGAGSLPPSLLPLAERFDQIELLGRGGMGSVYRARDRASGRIVALKVINGTSQVAQERFLSREGQLTAALNHPGIVKIHSGGEVGGVPYLAYELVEDPRPLLPEPAGRDVFLEHLCQVADAVGHAHGHGIVHRDLKPENVLVDAAGRVRVADFGLAWSEGADQLTKTGALVGTPRYLAPECWGTVQHDARVDVWSLGVLLYEGLTGQTPFPGENLQELMAQLQRSTPTPPRRLDPSISQAVEAVCLQALTRDPADRYRDATVFAEALRHARTAAPKPRHRGGVAAGLAVLLAVGAALAVALNHGADEPTPSDSSSVLVTPSGDDGSGDEGSGDDGSGDDASSSAMSERESARADRKLARLRRIKNLRKRSAALDEWLAAYPSRAHLAQEDLIDLRRRVPRLSLRVHTADVALRREFGHVFVGWLAGERVGWARRDLGLLTNFAVSAGERWETTESRVITSGAYSPDGKTAALAGSNRIMVYRRSGDTHKETLTVHIRGLPRVGVSAAAAQFATNDRLFVGYEDGKLCAVDLSTSSAEVIYQTARRITGLATPQTGRWLAVGEWAQRQDALGGTRVVLLDGAGKGVGLVNVPGFYPVVRDAGDERTLIVAGGTREIWRLSYGETGLAEAGSFRGRGVLSDTAVTERFVTGKKHLAHSVPVRDVAVWGGKLFSIAADRERAESAELRVWSLETEEELWRVSVRGFPHALAAGPAGVIVGYSNAVDVYASE